MTPQTRAGYRPNAAIGFEQRPVVAEAIRFYAESEEGRRRLGDAVSEFRALATRLEQPGPPLVSTADVFELLELVTGLQRLEGGEALDHPWGFVRREAETDGRGFRLAAPGQSKAEGNWVSDVAIELAHEMYEGQLRRRGLLPQRG